MKKNGTRYFLLPFPHPTFQTLSVLFSLARKDTKRAYRDPRTLVPLGTSAFGTALGVGSRGIILFLFFSYEKEKDIFVLMLQYPYINISQTRVIVKFEWDENKSQTNKLKHDIDFEEAKRFWEDNNALIIPANIVDSETRYALISRIAQKCYVAIFSIRDKKYRIISVRRCRKNEEISYESFDRKTV